MSAERGRECAVRTDEGSLDFYFVRGGTYFGTGERGFSSERPVTLYIEGAKGKIISPGTRVTFRRPRTQEVLLDGSPAGLLSRTDARVTLFVPAGTHSISFG